MFTFDDQKYNTNKLALGVIIVFLFHLFLATIIRNFIIDPTVFKSLRSSEDFWLNLGWLIMGHFILSLYFNLFFMLANRGKGILEGLKLGFIAGFLYIGINFVSWAYVNYKEEMPLQYFLFLLMVLIGPALDGLLLSLIYKKGINDNN